MLFISYFIVPMLLNYPPNSELIFFQQKVESVTHVQQYIIIYLLFTVATLIFISILYRDIFRLYEGKSIKKSLVDVRQKTFSMMPKLMLFQLGFIFTVLVLLAATTPDTSFDSKVKLILAYITIIGCISVITDFVLSPELKKFVIWSSIHEENYVFKYKKAFFKNRVILRILPLIMIIIVIVSFFGYSTVIKEVGKTNNNYYREEIIKLNLSFQTLDQVIEGLNNISKLNNNDYYFYSYNQEDYFVENDNNLSLFVREYIKAYSDENGGHVYDFYGVEKEGYIHKIQLFNGETLYIGFMFSISSPNVLLMYIMAFILLISITIIYLRIFSNSVSTDIKDVASNLNKIASDERNVLIEKLPISSNDEIGEIISAYNKIQDLNKSYINDLNIAKEQAEKANEYKTEFLSNMSHEIRTPLNAIVGFANSMVDEDIPEETKEEVKDIIMASHILLDIVNSILDISKIEANKLEIINSEYDPNTMLYELVALTEARIGDKSLEFRTSFDPSIPPMLYGDVSRLKQIILNLLTNAVKYTKEGYVEFKVTSIVKDDICRLMISIEDTGVGIKPEDIDKLFNKFERLNAGGTSSIEGTGLGLAITKKLVELMGGQIVVQSIFGKGSKFSVAINQRIGIGKPKVDKSSHNTQVIQAIDFSDKKVLVVDDNKLNLKVAIRLLSAFSIKVTTVDSGRECIELIKAGEQFDLILLDDMMPKLSGTDTLKILRENSSFNIPVVALTANAITGMREKYLGSGFDDYLAKPIEKTELYRVLIQYLSNNE